MAKKARAQNTKPAARPRDLVVKKQAAGVRGGVYTKVQLSGPFDDYNGGKYTASGDPTPK